MSTTPEAPLSDEDITTSGAGVPDAGAVAHDADGTDGHDADGTDGHDADGTDA